MKDSRLALALSKQATFSIIEIYVKNINYADLN